MRLLRLNPSYPRCNMSPLVATLLWKVVVPCLVEILKRTGAINWAEALAAHAAQRFIQAVEHVKVDPSYPSPPVSTSKGPENGNYNKSSGD